MILGIILELEMLFPMHSVTHEVIESVLCCQARELPLSWQTLFVTLLASGSSRVPRALEHRPRAARNNHSGRHGNGLEHSSLSQGVATSAREPEAMR